MTELLREIAGPGDLRHLHRQFPERYPFLLQSTAPGGERGRFDILFASPGDALVLDKPGSLHGPHTAGQRQFLAALDAWWRAERRDPGPTRLPFTGGWFLYLGYELAAEVEPGLDLHSDPLLPVAFAVRCPAALAWDHAAGHCELVEETPGDFDSAAFALDIAAAKQAPHRADVKLGSVAEEPAQDFIDAVVHAKHYIEAGDIYQANLSREWRAEVNADLDANAIYESLCASNPGPFAGIARWRDIEIVSSSPERLLAVRNGIASTRPIAGTRPRSADGATDQSLSAELFAHPKERAEHIMLIDLERNDLGRVCIPGSVEVDEMMVLESYAHVHHIVSNVRGRLRSGVTPGQAIAAVFPGGTITGCPKVRCMEIIARLENGPRGAYTGSFGYLNRDGSLDLNILIRTIVKQGAQVRFRAGAGIVADSDPVAELEETRAKAEGMLRAIKR